MTIPGPAVAGWYHAVLLAGLPWLAFRRPGWAPLAVAAAVLVHGYCRRTRAAEPWASVAVTASAVIFLVAQGGSRPAAAWAVLAAVVIGTARILPRDDGGRPDAADLLAALGWGAAFVARPGWFEVAGGGWLAPAVLLVAARQLGAVVGVGAGRSRVRLGPPTREVRGTLSLRDVVVTAGGLPSTVPIALDLRAGDSLAVLCDDRGAAQALAEAVAGRTRPAGGEVLIDGSPLRPDDRLVALVAAGEPFLAAGLRDNLGALRDEPLDRTTFGAARDACSLAEVAAELNGRPLAPDGDPLTPYQRLLVLAARVLVSPYRVVVVVDPGPWVDAQRSDAWRAALVRTSVGRTAIWITDDRELADRADRVIRLLEGALRPL